MVVGHSKQALNRGLVSRSFRQSTAVFGTLPVMLGVARHDASNAILPDVFQDRNWSGVANVRFGSKADIKTALSA
jgi:hypothetical protein